MAATADTRNHCRRGSRLIRSSNRDPPSPDPFWTNPMAEIPNVNPDSRAATVMEAPDKMVRVRELFGIDSDMEVPAFSEADERVPDLDPAYFFDTAPTDR